MIPAWLDRLRPRPSSPTILQMEALECGAAALAMVLAHHGRWVSLESLRIDCGVSRDGSKASNVLKAARHHGLTAKGQRLEPEQLKLIKLPAILFVNMNHFVVLDAISAHGYHINDPGSGRRIMDHDSFDRAFSGIALVFEPGPEFTPGGAPAPLWPRLKTLVQTIKRPMAMMAATGLLVALLTMVGPGLQQIYVDNILISQLDNWVLPLTIVLAILIPTLALLSWLRMALVARIGVRLATVLSSRSVWHVMRLPVGFFVQRYAGIVNSRISLADNLGASLARLIADTAINLSLIFFLGLLLIQYNAMLTLLVVVLAALNAALFKLLQRPLKEASERVAMQFVKLQSKTQQGLRMIESLKSTGTEAMYFAKWSGLHALYVNAQQESTRWTALLMGTQFFIATLISATVLMLGGYLTLSDDLTLGMLVAFAVVAGLFTQPVNGLINAASELEQMRGQLNQVDDTLNHPMAPEFESPTQSASATHAPARRDATRRLARLSGDLSVQRLSFGYAPLAPPLINDLSFEVSAGQRLALVGTSGSGKSTIGRLVSGLLEPRSGDIAFDGLPMREVDRDLLRNSIAVVDQDIVLFEGSVRDNITLWDPTMPEAYITTAARDAEIHDFIMSLAGGYEAKIEENGRNLSGGQRQRLEIARALVGNPSIIILDEATSALDAETEKCIMDNLLRRGCTSLIIAHRLSTIRDCDQILLLDQGTVIERGTHTELMASDGPYRGLIET